MSLAKEISRNDVTRKQKETAYIIYMMLGSFFQKAHCRNTALEANLFLYYKEMLQNKQVQREEQILARLNQLFGKIKQELEELQCDVYLRKEEDLYRMIFWTGIRNFLVEVEPDGKFHISEGVHHSSKVG